MLESPMNKDYISDALTVWKTEIITDLSLDK